MVQPSSCLTLVSIIDDDHTTLPRSLTGQDCRYGARYESFSAPDNRGLHRGVRQVQVPPLGRGLCLEHEGQWTGLGGLHHHIQEHPGGGPQAYTAALQDPPAG